MILYGLVLLTIVPAAVGAHPDLPTPQRGVTICLDGLMDPGLRTRAPALASEIYARIGVAVTWRTGTRGCPADGIQVQFTDDRPDSYHPGALATSLPYEGIHVEVLINRIREAVDPKIVTTLLAHVLVHETAHILQGVSRHSETGLMKRAFNMHDFMEMVWRPLSFTDEDTTLIYLGMERRARRLIAGSELSPRFPDAGSAGR